MTITKEIFVDLEEKFSKVLKLIETCSETDPEIEPFLSKYAARQILLDMNKNLEGLLSNKHPQHTKLTAMLAAVQLYLGIVHIETEELSEGGKHLLKCLEIVKDHINTPEMVMIVLNAYNQCGILWSHSEPEKSTSYLKKAEELYVEYKKLEKTPIDIKDLFTVNAEEKNPELGWKNFEFLHTFTLFYLAQVYGVLKDHLKSSIYCHNTLQRQLDSKESEPIDWALNAATLSQFFMEQNGFKQARHHLAASSHILDQYQETLNAITERTEAYDAKIEVFKHRSADVARCWAKYGLLLLSKSKERLLSHTDDIDTNCSIISDLSALNLEPNSTVSSDDLQNLQFTSLDLSHYENQITHKFVLTLQDARLVFLNIQNWLQKAESYYTLENLASDHIEIVQDQAQMYLNFLFFEENPDNQAKLHKRRIDLLENIIKKVNSQYYLKYCRQIWFDLGQTYCDLLNIKADKMRESNERPTANALIKINGLVERSIHNFNCFIESFKEAGKNELPKKVHSDFEAPFLRAYFHIAALHGKYIDLSKEAQLRNTQASFNNYKKVVDYAALNESAMEVIPAELGISKEMVQLLPLKLVQLGHDVASSS